MADKNYRQKVEDDNAANLARSRRGRDIGDDYPRRRNSKARDAGERDLRLFLETYFPASFWIPWSADHLRVIGRMQEAILDGGLFALAMPRGAGKTAISVRASLWGLLYRHRRFVALIGSTEDDAAKLLAHVKAELLNNDRLARDFRHVCYPIRRLENNARRCVGQLFRKQRTAIVWSASQVTFPTMPDGPCLDGPNVSGSTIAVAGLTGAIRGQAHTLASGEILRPDFVILDDCQTSDSAKSPSQTADRRAIIEGDVLGMSGPKRRITAVMPCTVIHAGDLADQFLDRQQCPAWRGEKTMAVYEWPSNEALWEQYHRIRDEALRSDGKPTAATEFYRQHRQEMDLGARIAWPDRFNDDELSAVQYVMNLRADLKDPAFFAEYMNTPLKAEGDTVAVLSVDDIAAKVNGIPRGVVPLKAEHLTAFVDVHDALLFWAVCGWAADFTGWAIAYGTYPDQVSRLFTLRKANPTLADLAPGAGREGAIRAGLDALAHHLLGREWQREGGVALRIGRCLVDAGYVPDCVYDFCRHSAHAAVLMPSRGVGIGAKSRSMLEYSARPGERLGWHWLTGQIAERALRYCRFDANHWKTFIQARLAVPLGDKASLTLYGSSPADHRLFAEHVAAEISVRVTANGRTCDEWSLRPGVADNHWLDTLTGNAVAASMLGASLAGATPAPKPARGAATREEYEKKRREFEARRNY
jgi:hypothetical protein